MMNHNAGNQMTEICYCNKRFSTQPIQPRRIRNYNNNPTHSMDSYESAPPLDTQFHESRRGMQLHLFLGFVINFGYAVMQML